MEVLLTLDGFIALLTLTFLEIVLGIDNIIFISIVSDRLPLENQSKARTIGLVLAILIRVFSNQPPKAILEAQTNFIDQIGLKEHLSPTRANGLVSMIKQIKMYAVAYQTQLN